MKTPAWLATALLAVLPVVLPAQSYRTTVETRRVAADRPLKVELGFGVGELTLRRSEAAHTYRIGMTYAEDVFNPEVRYEANAGTLTIKLAGEGGLRLNDSHKLDQELDVALPGDVPLDLSLSFGAIEAHLELGGLTLRTAEIKTGASETAVTFAQPTLGTCDQLTFNVGAAQFEARQLGNSGCRTISLAGAVGEMELEFSGERLAPDTRLFIKVGLGEVRLRIPEAVGIRVESDRFLASVDRAGLVKHGSAYLSPGYDEARTKLTIEIDAALGSVEIERIH